jgi:hypothetical protein
MASLVAIWNKALSGCLGERAAISQPNEQSAAAAVCRLHYDTTRDTLLASHDWTFARRRVSLADLGSPPQLWAYRYQLPSDCIRDRRITPAMTGQAVRYEMASDKDAQGGDIQVLYTDLSPAELVYTARVTNTELYPPMFVEALAWSLAAAASDTITASKSRQDMAIKRAGEWTAYARADDMNRGMAGDIQPLPESLRVRGYGGSSDYSSSGLVT